MSSLVPKSRFVLPQFTQIARMSSQMGDLGSGAGKGGGGGGAIREAGGAFGKLEAAREEEYFHKKKLEQLRDIKNADQTDDKNTSTGAKK